MLQPAIAISSLFCAYLSTLSQLHILRAAVESCGMKVNDGWKERDGGLISRI